MHMVCVPADCDGNPVRQFYANTADLQEIVAWQKNCCVKTIAMESTGIYWIPVFELLESEGYLKSAWWNRGNYRVAARAPRRTSSTRNGSSGCTPTASAASFRLPDSVLGVCVPIGGNGKCKCATPPAMSSTCRRPWSK